MGKKNKAKEVVEERPSIYCFYCDREFTDEKILIQHQKAKHFKCHLCAKKLSTVGGLVIHVTQVHKEAITTVPNAKPGRDSVENEVYGMEGIPDDLLPASAKRFKTSAPTDPTTFAAVAGHPIMPPRGMVPPYPPVPPYPLAAGYPPPPGPYGQPRPPAPMPMPMHAPPPFQPPRPGLPLPLNTRPPPNASAPAPLPPGSSAVSGAPSPSTATPSSETSAAPPPPPPSEFKLIYEDSPLSMEERRAMLPRYRIIE
mmetsp:Transcript_4067/g.6303  ORF Transcript_4067/g.6303 Transcript_4067/m.6303 type:complete len:255 (+) Transcript_4067:140-904(+)|eukprot:CAMPEP_0185027236 /NCGR_PEP_ID=MMETSP1103-20130426/12040_1 /TAXON_ID=36769 /ORGANISM="Paraphysomonas bandaiensis, Strain Caron Lab Isolate" /LENGTH=254 /DNA_ID=CAMNT_0027561131 /DNA_START=48 /DNA_END=809 /DNA_ORIENTATION=+